jgi:hypothetical protein
MVTEGRVTDLVTVYVTQGQLRANVIRGVLESAGIPVILKYEAAGPAIGITINGLGRVEIQVPDEWAQEAIDLLTATPRSGEIFSVPSDTPEETEQE